MTTLQIPTTTAQETIPPPPYTPPANLSCFFPSPPEQQEEEYLQDLLEEETDEPEESSSSSEQTTNITLSAPITIHGHGNIISFPTQEFTRMAAWIVASVQKTTATEGRARANISINLNCGIMVNGQRNVVGTAVGAGVATRAVRMQNAAAASAGVNGAVRTGNTATTTTANTSTVPTSGSKRKAEEDVDVDVEDGPVVKRVNIGAEGEETSSSSSPSSPSS